MAVYDGETGRSGYYRTTKGHKKDLEINKTDKSALAKHIGLYHRDKTGDPSIYGVKVNNTACNDFCAYIHLTVKSILELNCKLYICNYMNML